MALYKIRKRNGAIVTFNRGKIEEAIQKAIQAAGGDDFSRVVAMTDDVIASAVEHAGKDLPNVEMIQDAVEEILIK
jgi:ribonucleoside-triphosphate reductase